VVFLANVKENKRDNPLWHIAASIKSVHLGEIEAQSTRRLDMHYNAFIAPVHL